MNILRKAAGSAVMAALVVAATASGASAQWPERDITFIVPYGPGGSTDPVSRAFATELSKELGVNVIVENRPGGSATIGTGNVLQSQPDGYTIGLGSNSSLMHQPLERPNLPWSTPDDFYTVVKLVDVPSVLYVREDAPWQTLAEFLAEVDGNPGGVRASVSGLRTAPDLVVQYYNQLSGQEIRTIPFTGGGGEALTAVLSGRVESSVGYGPSIKGYVDAGQIRTLGVFQEGPYEAFPDAEPISTTGHEAYLAASYYVIAPNGLPDEVRQRLTEASTRAIESEAFRTFADTNTYILDPLTNEQASEELARYREIFSSILEQLGQ